MFHDKQLDLFSEIVVPHYGFGRSGMVLTWFLIMKQCGRTKSGSMFLVDLKRVERRLTLLQKQ